MMKPSAFQGITSFVFLLFTGVTFATPLSELESPDGLLGSTYLGGSALDGGFSLALDSDGNVFLGGYTSSSDLPVTPGALDTTYNGGDYDLYIAKFDPGLTTLLAATYLGGSATDGPFAFQMALDAAGHLYVAGATGSADFPTTPGAFDETYNGGVADFFVARISNDLTTLQASTFLGGSKKDGGDTVVFALDHNGHPFVGGYTKSGNIPTTPGAFDETRNDPYGDGYVAKLDPDCTTLLAATYLGGTSIEYAMDMEIDENGTVIISGSTSSANFPVTPGAYDSVLHGGDDGFISRLDNDLTTLLASTLLGASGSEYCAHVALDDRGRICVSGATTSPDYPVTPGAYDQTLDSEWDIFSAKLDSDLQTLECATYLGGTGYEFCHAMIVDEDGGLWFSGGTQSVDFPTTAGAFKETYQGGAFDTFITRLSKELDRLSVSTFVGGSEDDLGYALASNEPHTIFLAGPTLSADFPCSAFAYDATYNGGEYDAFLIEMRLLGLFCSSQTISAGQGGEITFSLKAGQEHAGRSYIVLGGMTGTSPGYLLPGDRKVLPLNWDGFTDAVIAWINTPLFDSFLGTLDATGQATAKIDSGPVPGFIGTTMHFACTLGNPFDFVSNPVEVEIVP
ncbi:MAG: SBBP repeat-containing protein [Planctomycetes bacterium]|nr:SBBP repeat-containing protein [Planctomycetota bacterium]